MKHSPFIVGDFNIKSIKEEDSEYFIVSGYASVYGNVDQARDIVMQGAFANDLMEKGNVRPILWQHNSGEPIGVGTFEEKEEGLKVTMKLPKADDFVMKRVMPQIKAGSVKGLSIGYYIVEEQYDREERINRLVKLRLRETSAVTFACNELAQITAAKQFLGIEETKNTINSYPLADEKTEWNEIEAIESIKINTGSEEIPSKNYGKFFINVDDSKKDSFDSYSLPYVKYIDNEFKIVPAAIYKLAGHIFASKSTDDSVKDFINDVYKKTGKEEPFKNDDTFFIDHATLKNMENSDLESVFNNTNVIFSSKSKEMIVSAFRSPGSDGSVQKENKSDLLSFLKKANDDMETI